MGRGCSTSLNRRMRTRSTVVWGGSSARMTLTRLFVVAPVHFDGCRVGALNGRSFSGTLPNHVEYRSSYSTDQRTPKALNAASSCELEIGEVNSEKAIIPKNMQGIIGPQCWRAAITLSDTRTSPAIIPDQVVGGSARATQSSNNPSPLTANQRTRSTILRRDLVQEAVIVLAFCNARVAPNASSVQL